jgi:hypothetical protein
MFKDACRVSCVVLLVRNMLDACGGPSTKAAVTGLPLGNFVKGKGNHVRGQARLIAVWKQASGRDMPRNDCIAHDLSIMAGRNLLLMLVLCSDASTRVLHKLHCTPPSLHSTHAITHEPQPNQRNLLEHQAQAKAQAMLC